VYSVDDHWVRGPMMLNAGTVSYLHMHTLAELHGWLAELMPLPVDDRGGVDHPAGRLTHGGAWLRLPAVWLPM
jgi:hypothetical protein